jgi:gas vesicle protein
VEDTVSRNNSSDSAIWFLAGAAVGATVALLFAPQSGERTRRLLGRKAEEGREAVLDRGRELYDKGREIADEAAQLFERGKKIVEG